jgi:small-conductance mechanosensitive channel
MNKRQKIRKGLILFSFFLFPALFYYLSPFLIIQASSKGVKELLLHCYDLFIIQYIPWRLQDREPRVLLQDFGDSAVVFGVYLNVEDPWQQRIYMSDLRKAIWFAFQDADITITYNQVDIHFDPPVTQAFEGLKKIK